MTQREGYEFDAKANLNVYEKDIKFLNLVRGKYSQADFIRFLLNYYLRGQRNDTLDKNIASLVTDPNFEISGFSEPAKSVYERYGHV